MKRTKRTKKTKVAGVVSPHSPLLPTATRTLQSGGEHAFVLTLRPKHEPIVRSPSDNRVKLVDPRHQLPELDFQHAAQAALKPVKPSLPVSTSLWNQGMTNMVRYLQSARINLRDLAKWRWLDGEVGEVQGLPKLRGKAVMTNGVIMLMELGDGRVVKVHFDWFVEDDKVEMNGSGKSEGRGCGRGRRPKMNVYDALKV